MSDLPGDEEVFELAPCLFDDEAARGAYVAREIELRHLTRVGRMRPWSIDRALDDETAKALAGRVEDAWDKPRPGDLEAFCYRCVSLVSYDDAVPACGECGQPFDGPLVAQTERDARLRDLAALADHEAEFDERPPGGPEGDDDDTRDA